MSDSTEFELPQATEKLSYKFILDSLNDLHRKGMEPTPVASPPESGTEIEAQTLEPKLAQCGSQAELPIDIEQEPHEMLPMAELNLPAGKKYFRIGEVSELIGVEAYVLRYWESEFSVIRPVKSGSGHRVYSRKDVEALHVIRHLLHIEKYSIKGAKKKFGERKKEITESHTTNKQYLRQFSQELKELIQMIRST